MKVGLTQTLTTETLENIVEFYEFRVSDLIEIFSYENFVYSVNFAGNEAYLRISHGNYNSVELIKAELEWIDYLTKHRIEVIKPIPSKTGEFVNEVKTQNNSFIFVLFEKIGGENFTENLDLLTPDRIQQWGKLVGNLHILSKKYEISDPKISRLHISEDPLLSNLDVILEDYPIILELAKKTMSEINKLPKSNDVYGIIHRDLHEANLIMKDGSMTIIDFDDCHYNWYIADIAIILFHYAWRFANESKSKDQLIEEFYPIFMKGYLSVNKLDQFWIDKIPLFIKLRHYSLFCILAYELKIEYDEWSTTIKENWLPMLQNNMNWINLDTELPG